MCYEEFTFTKESIMFFTNSLTSVGTRFLLYIVQITSKLLILITTLTN